MTVLCNRLSLVMLVMLGLTAPPTAFAAPPTAFAAPKTTANPEQMTIEAASTLYDGKAHTYRVRGKVRITLPQMVVTCDQATIYAAASEDKILRVVFSGHVEAKRGSDSFKAERITYHVAERRLVAEGTTQTRIQLPTGAGGPLSLPLAAPTSSPLGR